MYYVYGQKEKEKKEKEKIERIERDNRELPTTKVVGFLAQNSS